MVHPDFVECPARDSSLSELGAGCGFLRDLRALRQYEALNGGAQLRGQLVGLARGHSRRLDRLTDAERELAQWVPAAPVRE